MSNRPYKNIKRFVGDISKEVDETMKEKEAEEKDNSGKEETPAPIDTQE